MSVDLDFRARWTPSSPSNLLLAFAPEVPPTPPLATGRVRAKLGALGARAQATLALRVSRPTAAQLGAVWRDAAALPAHISNAWRESERVKQSSDASWQSGLLLAVTVARVGNRLDQPRSRVEIDWRNAMPIEAHAATPFASLSARHLSRALAFVKASSQLGAWRAPFVQLVPTRAERLLDFATGQAVAALWTSRFALATAQPTVRTLPWARAKTALPGQSSLPTGPVPPPPITASTQLNFCCPQNDLRWQPTLVLNFSHRPCAHGAGLLVPTLRVYFVHNAVEVVRLPGREPVPVSALNLRIDSDSWAWGFDATLPRSALEAVVPTTSGPVEIEITVNGVIWIMLVESYDLRQSFGSSDATVHGRSRAAYLAEPYAPTRSFSPSVPFTARQLAEQELTRATLITGFELDWQLPDWLVPESAWSYSELTPMQVISRIVASVGGSLNAHPHRNRLIAQSRYPALPWEWPAQIPQCTMPLDVVHTLSARWSEKPAFNGVYIAGERAGVIARVTRSGTAGDLLAPMVIEPLITHVDAARERGRAVLSDTGRQLAMTLELPMLPSLGLLMPGHLIAVGENASAWRGLVRGTTVSAQWRQSLEVRQVVEVERHVAWTE
jgi:hypothetical protein